MDVEIALPFTLAAKDLLRQGFDRAFRETSIQVEDIQVELDINYPPQAFNVNARLLRPSVDFEDMKKLTVDLAPDRLYIHNGRIHLYRVSIDNIDFKLRFTK